MPEKLEIPATKDLKGSKPYTELIKNLEKILRQAVDRKDVTLIRDIVEQGFTGKGVGTFKVFISDMVNKYQEAYYFEWEPAGNNSNQTTTLKKDTGEMLAKLMPDQLAVTTTCADKEERLKDAEEARDKAEKDRDDAVMDRDDMQRRLKEAEEARATAEMDRDDVQSLLAEAGATAARDRAEAAKRLKQVEAKAVTDLKQAESDLVDTQDRLKHAESLRVKAESNLKNAQSKAAIELDELKALLDKAEAGRTEDAMRLKQVEVKAADTEKERAEMEKRLEETESTAESLRVKAESDLDNMQERLKQVEAKAESDLKNAQSKAETEYGDLEGRFNEAKAKNAKLEEDKASLEAKLEGTHNENVESDDWFKREVEELMDGSEDKRQKEAFDRIFAKNDG